MVMAMSLLPGSAWAASAGGLGGQEQLAADFSPFVPILAASLSATHLACDTRFICSNEQRCIAVIRQH